MLPIPNIPGVKHTFININHAKIHIAQAGKGKPLLLLHGWPQHWYVWRKVIPELSKIYHLIMPDLPGFGWSDMPKDKDFRKENLAKDIVELLDVLKLKQVGLIGHDWGGWIGFLMCAQAPKRFNAFLALGIGYPFSTNKIPLVQMWRFLYQVPIAMPFLGENLLHSLPGLTEGGIKQCAYKKDAWTKEELHMFSIILQNPKKAEASSLLYRTFLTKELPILNTYRNRKLRVPTRLLIGENDPIINPVLFQDFKQIANLHIEFIKNCGHFIPEEQPEVVIKRIKEIFI